ncbi:hypothetical protein [Haliangium sp.]|uniref:hypothetical protein n=1 Tax=Haliangium sp. TaxID=2663208 RepID=UPI003D0AC7B1
MAEAKDLIDAMRACLEDLGRELSPLLFPGRDAPPALDPGAVLASFAELVERDVNDLVACLQALREHDQLGPGELAARRERAASTLRDALFRVRTLLVASFGPRAAHDCGLAGRVPERPEELLVYGHDAARALDRAASSYQAPAPFVHFDLSGAADFVRDQVTQMRACEAGTGDLERARLTRRYAVLARRSVARRDAALALIEALAPLVGMDERARALRARADAQPLSSVLGLADLLVAPSAA